MAATLTLLSITEKLSVVLWAQFEAGAARRLSEALISCTGGTGPKYSILNDWHPLHDYTHYYSWPSVKGRMH